MATFEQTSRNLDDSMEDVKRTGRRVARNVRVAGEASSQDIRALLDELDDSLRSGTDTDIDALRARLTEQLANARTVFDDAQDNVRDRVRTAVAMTEDRIQDRPWESVGIVAGIAFLVGVIVGRG
jgi:ElaB/YqjD/DUF883 family membrane-anchored ribosome-binding protein